MKKIEVLSNNNIASNNNIQNNIEVVDGAKVFDVVLETLFMPKEKYQQLKSNIIAKQVENIEKILLKAKQIKDDYNINVIQPSLKFSIPFFEKASLEDETEMHEMWAKLLISNKSNSDSTKVHYIDILSKIDGNRAKGLKHLYDLQKQHSQKWLVEHLLEIDDLSVQMSILLDSERDERAISCIVDDIITNKLARISKKFVTYNSQTLNSNAIFLIYSNTYAYLVNLGLVKVKTFPEIKVAVAYLTDFGYKFMECLNDR